jgi:hypothetical protein
MKFVGKLNSEVTTKNTVHAYVFLADNKFELSEDELMQLKLDYIDQVSGGGGGGGGGLHTGQGNSVHRWGSR